MENRIKILEEKVKDLECLLQEETQAHFLIEQRQRNQIRSLEESNAFLQQQVERYRGEVEELGAILDMKGWG